MYKRVYKTTSFFHFYIGVTLQKADNAMCINLQNLHISHKKLSVKDANKQYNFEYFIRIDLTRNKQNRLSVFRSLYRL